MSRRQTITLSAVLAAAVLACLWRLVVGGDSIGFPGSADTDLAIWNLRLIRMSAGVAVGGALAVGGVMLQSLLRNPLASPDLLGLSSGAGLAVMIATYAAAVRTGELSIPPAAQGVAALVGAVAALVVVYALSQRRGVIEPVSMILVGVIVSIICGAGTMLLQRLMPDRGMSSERWFLGQLTDDLTWTPIAVVGAVTLALTALGACLGPAMDAGALGDDEARSVGVPVGRLRALLFVASGVLTAAAVFLVGPVGFVGLVCPHVVRLGAGPAHRVVVIGSALAGAALVVGADAAIKTPSATWLPTGRLPLGVLTALIGGPIFLWLLLREMKGR